MLCTGALQSGLGNHKKAKNWIISTKKRTRNQVDFIHNCVELKRKTLSLKESIHKNTEKILTSNNFIAIVFASSYYKAIKKNQHFLFIPNIGNATEKVNDWWSFFAEKVHCASAPSLKASYQDQKFSHARLANPDNISWFWVLLPIKEPI